MTHPPPESPHPPPPQSPYTASAQPTTSHAQSASRQGGWGRVLLVSLVSLVIGAVVAVVAGVGSFLGTRTLTGGGAGVRCGSADLCFASFEAEDIRSFLTERGFECEGGDGRECELRTASGRYSLFMSIPDGDGRVRRFEAGVHIAPGVEMPGPGEQFHAWFAELPFADDPDRAEEATQWVAQHRQVGGDGVERTTIGSYDYSLINRADMDQTVTLMVEAGETWL